MPESSPPIIVDSPAALHSAVDSAAITPSDTLLLRPLKAKIDNLSGIRVTALEAGPGGNDIGFEIVLPDNENAEIIAEEVGSGAKITLAASGTPSVLVANNITFKSVVKGTDGNAITVAFVDPGTASATASVEVTGTDIVVNLGTDAGSHSTLTNQGITYTAKASGAGGDAITIALVNPATPSAALSVGVVSNAITVNLATDAGTAQVETATGAGTVSGSGNASIVVTGVGITGSPLTIPVAVVATDTPAIWVDKARVVLAATAAITALYAVGGTGADITLTEKIPNGNDGTLNVAIATGTATGITTAATSVNTTAGVAPAITSTRQQVALAVNASLTARTLVTAVDPGTSTVVTALGATNLAGGGANPSVSTNRNEAVALLLAETDVTDIVDVTANEQWPPRPILAIAETTLSGGSVTSTSTVEDVVNAIMGTTANAYVVCESIDAEIGSELCQPTDGVVETEGGANGQWSIDSSFTRALSANVAGDISYLPYNSDEPVTITVVSGQFYPIATRGVLATNTTATGIVGHI